MASKSVSGVLQTREHKNEKKILPLGALMFSAALSVWAQANTESETTTVAPVKFGPQKTEKTLAPVTVSANRDRNNQTYQSGLVSLGKTIVNAKDIPQSLTIVNDKLMHDQGKDTVKDALVNVPGITFEAGEGGRIGDNIRLRGFSVSGDIYLDGMRDIAQYNRDTFNVDRIEVLRGSASMLFGRGSTGGIVNQVSRQPRLMTEYEINTTLGTGNYLRLGGDFNFKTDDDAALRINAMSTDWNGRAGLAETHRKGLALDYRWGIGTANEFGFSLYHLEYKDKPDFGFGWLGGRPSPYPTSQKWYGLASDYQQDSADVVTLNHTHRWLDGSTLKTTLRDGTYLRDLWATTSKVASGVTLDNFNSNSVVNRASQTRAGQEHHTFVQTDYNAKTTLLGVRSELLFGAEYALERSTRYSYTATPAKPDTTIALADNTSVIDTRSKSWANDFTAATLGLYAQDTLQLAPMWKLVLGLRYDDFGGDYARAVGGPLSRSDKLLSKRAGLLYQPSDDVTYYASYGTSFNTSGDLYQYDPSTANTAPESAQNLELGAKWELLDGDLSLRTALARTDKFNERNTDTTTVPGGAAYLLSGQRHTDALEFEVAGRITPNWDIFAGLVFMRGVIDQAGASAASQLTVGQNPGLTPDRQANLWSTYRINSQWRAGGGFSAVSQNKPADSVTTVNRAPGYAKVDALLEYQIDPKNKLKLNLDNLFDKVYYSSLYRGFVVPGPDRSLRMTWTVKF
ncbi:MAG: TonB-dependent siderophore receptor [Burkholderiaceae bacterium]